MTAGAVSSASRWTSRQEKAWSSWVRAGRARRRCCAWLLDWSGLTPAKSGWRAGPWPVQNGTWSRHTTAVWGLCFRTWPSGHISPCVEISNSSSGRLPFHTSGEPSASKRLFGSAESARTWPIGTPTNSLVASNSGLRWPGLLSVRPACCCSTNPYQASILSCECHCAASSRPFVVSFISR